MLPESGVTTRGPVTAADGDGPDAVPTSAPEPFRTGVQSILATCVRPEARVEQIRAPQRLAPWSFAVAIDVSAPASLRAGNPRASDRGASESTAGMNAAADIAASHGATGRLVVLYDPEGFEAWDGEMRLVAYAQADITADMAGDPLLSAVGWSWLTEALRDRAVDHTAVGGTVTQTTSTRFGDVHGPSSTTQLELRGSWTARSTDLSGHLLAFTDLLCLAAGLPPEGVAVLGGR